MSVTPEPLLVDALDPVVVGLLDRCRFPPRGAAVVCGVSGGADSTALLALAVAAGLVVEAVHVDHGLRPGGSVEAAAVGSLAHRWGAAFRSVTAVVAPGANVEERARTARHRALGPDALLGHTADDQAETVLIRLLRGTGPAGLAAMSPRRHPLLRLRRADARGLCEHLGVTPLDDPSNRDDRFVRNRVRHEVLPVLADVAGRDMVPLLARLAEQSADQNDLIVSLAADVDPTDCAALTAVARPIAAVALRTWWMAESGATHPPDAAATERMMSVALGTVVGCDIAEGWSLRRSGRRLRIVGPTDEPADRRR